MSQSVAGIFNFADRLQMEALNQRVSRSHVLSSNIANAETPGFRALGYDFEEQLQEMDAGSEKLSLKVTHESHKNHAFTSADGTINPDVFVRPTETIPEDGNTVDIDIEMASLSQNQILYRATVEAMNRKIGMIRYAIQGGR